MKTNAACSAVAGIFFLVWGLLLIGCNESKADLKAVACPLVSNDSYILHRFPQI
jgi:hypothetical protein